VKVAFFLARGTADGFINVIRFSAEMAAEKDRGSFGDFVAKDSSVDESDAGNGASGTGETSNFLGESVEVRA